MCVLVWGGRATWCGSASVARVCSHGLVCVWQEAHWVVLQASVRSTTDATLDAEAGCTSSCDCQREEGDEAQRVARRPEHDEDTREAHKDGCPAPPAHPLTEERPGEGRHE